MVFFNCNGCGEAMKKNQVEVHCQRCRQCQAVSCVDCGKDFWGNEYLSHTKCMTEQEKYCGKDYIPKVNKGEVKQEQWIEKVQEAIDKSISNPKLKGFLERLKDYPNIPRKKQKFENFLKNSLRVMSPALISQVWDILMVSTNSNGNKQVSANTNEDVKKTLQNAENLAICSETQDEEGDPSKEKFSKRERKEERKKKNKKEKKDLEEGKKGEKRKHEEAESGDIVVKQPVVSSKKNKKKKHKEGDDTSENGDRVISAADLNGTANSENAEDGVNSPEPSKKKKKKFDWESTVLTVLKAKEEISLKKLRKKVLNEFYAQDAANYNDENLRAKFDKKVSKMNKVKVFKDKVTLKKAK